MARADSTDPAPSYYTDRLNDPRAVYLDAPDFAAKGDGLADDTTALQSAINAVVERNGQGILFVPSGTYRITKTLNIWPGVRVIGFGTTRPRIVLGDNTPGFQTGPAYMIWFTGNVPGKRGHSGFRFTQPTDAPPDQIDFTAGPINDANPGTFYSALSNIDLAIGAGNPGAVGVRAHYAQHCFLAHIQFDIGSGLAGIYDGGNFAEDLTFIGGKYGIITHKTAPSWQFTLVDCSFRDQTAAAIQTEQAGLTLIRPSFKNVPTAIEINPGMAEELWMEDGRMSAISGPALIISNENNARTQINVEGIRCDRVPVFAQFRESGKQIVGKGPGYTVIQFSHGLQISQPSGKQGITTQFEAVSQIFIPAEIDSNIPKLPPQSDWVNVHDLGVKGDGVTDDTAALRQAVKDHRVLYFPCGAYLLSDTITLQPDSVLIGLHPSATRFYLADNTPAFALKEVSTPPLTSEAGGPAEPINNPPIPLIEVPSGGNAIVTGLGIQTEAINPRVVALLWKSGAHSLVNDVRFLGGHGTSDLSGAGEPVYNKDHTGDPNPARQWNVQPASLWVTDGGGGTFMDIWSPNTFAKSGLLVSNTTTPGRVYELSCEHHVDHEIVFDGVQNWRLYAMQTEEERGESATCLPLVFTNCRNLTIVNTFNYRVVSSDHTAPAAISVDNSTNLRFINTHCYSDSRVAFENLLVSDSDKIQVRQREIGMLNYFGTNESPDAQLTKPAVYPDSVEKIATGYSRISGLAVDPQGHAYFVDVPAQKIFRYDPATKTASLLTDKIPQPVNLVLDSSGNLLVVSYTDKIFSLDPAHPDTFTELAPQPTAPVASATYVIPRDFWRNENDLAKFFTAPRPQQIVFGNVVIPLEPDFISGRLYYGAKMHELLRAFGLQTTGWSFANEVGKVVQQPVFITDEMELKTYTAYVNADGSRTEPKLFVEDGGESVATDRGQVFIASGNINVYGMDRSFKGVISVPERPLSLASSPSGLYIAAGTSLYLATPHEK